MASKSRKSNRIELSLGQAVEIYTKSMRFSIGAPPQGTVIGATRLMRRAAHKVMRRELAKDRARERRAYVKALRRGITQEVSLI